MSIRHNQRLQSTNKYCDMIVFLMNATVCAHQRHGQHNGLNDLLIYTHIDRCHDECGFRSFFLRCCTFSATIAFSRSIVLNNFFFNDLFMNADSFCFDFNVLLPTCDWEFLLYNQCMIVSIKDIDWKTHRIFRQSLHCVSFVFCLVLMNCCSLWMHSKVCITGRCLKNWDVGEQILFNCKHWLMRRVRPISLRFHQKKKWITLLLAC